MQYINIISLNHPQSSSQRPIFHGQAAVFPVPRYQTPGALAKPSASSMVLPWYPYSWMVYFRENPSIKWAMNRGTPIVETTTWSMITQLWHHDIPSPTWPKKGRRTFSISLYSICFQEVNHRVGKQAFDPCPKVGTISLQLLFFVGRQILWASIAKLGDDWFKSGQFIFLDEQSVYASILNKIEAVWTDDGLGYHTQNNQHLTIWGPSTLVNSIFSVRGLIWIYTFTNIDQDY